MSARTKIEELTYSWYGYALVTAVVNVVLGGFGVFSIFLSVASLMFSLFLTFIIGRALVKKSSVVRFLMVCFSALSMVLGPIAAFVMFSFSLGGVVKFAMAIASVAMAYRSFSTLRESSVRAYFA